ncbi:MAG TPA: hypothetical protein PKW26_06775 [Treponemataceae bacterium]|nr:hypothetical protein [Treponemataceae bacterium]
MKKKLTIILCFFVSLLAFAAQQEKRFGNLKVVLHDVSLTHSLYFIDAQTEKMIPVFDTIDASSNNRFYLQTDLMMYSLTKSSGVIGSQQFTENGFQVLYEITDLATILFDYVFSASPGRNTDDFDLLSLSVQIVNKAKKTQNFALKAVFDTHLGEKTQTHFSTQLEPIIKTEMNFSRLVEEAWIKSSDGLRSIQFNFPESVSFPSFARLANKDFVLAQTWDINGLTGRSFNSVYSYNNSAVALYWAAQKTDPEKTALFQLSLSFAQDSLNPYRVLSIKTETQNISDPTLEKPSLDTTIIEEKSGLEEPLDDLSVQAENPYAYTKSITSDQLDKAYIEALLAKIEALENEDTSLDRTELLKLNAELDAILEFLRK